MTALRLLKIARDLWSARTRIAMMIAAIAVSVVMVTTFLSARAIISQEMTRNYAETHPASATVHVPGGVDADALAAVRAQENVLDATARATLQGRIRVGDGPWRTLVLFVSDPGDPQRISRVALQEGSWPPPEDGLLLERTALDYLGVPAGRQVIVAAPGGTPTTMTVTGTVHDGGVAPAEQEQTVYGYATTATLGTLGAPPVLDQIRVLVGDSDGPTTDAAAIDRTAQRVADALAARGRPATGIDIPPPGRHPHQGQMVTVASVLLAFGIVALLLSSILVATMLGGMLTAQTGQIGAMKAIGARTGQVLRMYLIQAAAISVAATAIAVPPGLALGPLLAGQGAELLNLDVAGTPAPGGVYAAALTAGIGVPLLVALVPLVRSSRITVRQAIDAQGTGTAVPGGRVERVVARLRGPGRTQLMALRNVFRRRGRLVLTAGLLAVAGSMFLTGLNTAGGWSALVSRSIEQRSYDAEIQLDQGYDAVRLTELALDTPGVRDAEAWGRTATSVHDPGRTDVAHVYPDEAHASFTVLAPPAGTRLMRLPLTAGRWLRPDDTDAVVLNHLVPAQQVPGITVGDDITLTVAGRPVTRRVVGIVSDFGTLGTAYLTDRDYAALTDVPGHTELLRVVTDRHDPAGHQAVLDRLEHTLAAAGIGIRQSTTIDTLRVALDGHVLVLADALIALAVVLGFVGLLSLASAMSTSVLERTREFGVLRALGATTTRIRGLVITEGVAIAILGLLLAAAAAVPLTRMFGDFLGTQAFRHTLPYVYSLPALVLWTLLTLAGAAAASAVAARRASRITVREALTTL
ncbi:FtsX-like permease family protein [Myceligenerans indicum]|uniref:ABC transporter permease n=1 Tax=Myceligenerans indicum TaxID=2593663 RepID=A0ABS1LM67_9MICO|nr:FtsX-like permease family protein [Myceligenerans indicum]MBL0886652.1 ABC transporter permease [Myceligenerans indicum]